MNNARWSNFQHQWECKTCGRKFERLHECFRHMIEDHNSQPFSGMKL